MFLILGFNFPSHSPNSQLTSTLKFSARTDYMLSVLLDVKARPSSSDSHHQQRRCELPNFVL